MQADYVTEIIRKYEKLPYDCILINGCWGIGKTYAVKEALSEKDNVCQISMFGLSDAKQIYHEVLFQLAMNNNKAGKVGEIAASFLDSISIISDKVAKAKGILESITKEREWFLLLTKEFQNFHYIVIDDLERAKENINFEEIFGIIDELKSCKYVKVILVANKDEMSKNNKNILDKFSEKVIDRTYDITERPQKVNWTDLKIHSGFISELLEKHDVKNLRTLQKAQKFYDDVKLFCEGINDEKFMEEVRLICFAIVIEVTDKLYYKEPDNNEKDSVQVLALTMSNELESRIHKYCLSLTRGNSLINLLIRYYQNEIILNEEFMKQEFQIFLQEGKQHNYYKTDEQIKDVLPELSEKIDGAKNIAELNQYTDEYMVWSKIINQDNSQVVEVYKEKLSNFMKEFICEGKESVLSYDHDLFHMSSEELKKMYSEVINVERKYMIEFWVNYLKKDTSSKKAYEYSYKLRRYLEGATYRDIIKEFDDELYNKNSFPIDDMCDEKEHSCYNIMKILYESDKNKFSNYCDHIFLTCDEMAKHRIENILREIKE